MTSHDTSCRNILVVDDDAIMRDILPAILKTEGHTVHTASSGAEALDWLADAVETVDLFLVDLQMPGLEGRELATRLNEVRRPATLLIGMSGSEPKTEVRAFFDAFLQKPFGLEAFREAVKRGEAARLIRLEALSGASSGEAVKKSLIVEPQIANPISTVTVLDETVYARLAGLLPPVQLHELYRISMEDVLRRVELIRMAQENGDLEQCRREAHAIKGGCGMVGATELSELADRMEEGSSDGTPPLADFAAACSRLRRMLDARL